MSIILQLVTKACCTSILPNNGVVNRVTCGTVPNYSSLSLICDTDGFDIRAVDTHFYRCFGGNAGLGRPYLIRIVFYPSWLGKYLCKFFLSNRPDLTLVVKYDSA